MEFSRLAKELLQKKITFFSLQRTFNIQYEYLHWKPRVFKIPRYCRWLTSINLTLYRYRFTYLRDIALTSRFISRGCRNYFSRIFSLRKRTEFMFVAPEKSGRKYEREFKIRARHFCRDRQTIICTVHLHDMFTTIYYLLAGNYEGQFLRDFLAAGSCDVVGLL